MSWNKSATSYQKKRLEQKIQNFIEGLIEIEEQAPSEDNGAKYIRWVKKASI